MIPTPPALAAESMKFGLKVFLIGMAVVGAGLLGAGLMANYKDAEIERLKRDHAQAEATVRQAAIDRLQIAIARGNVLESKLAQAEANRQTQAQEHAREIKRLTTGRPCLNAGTVRLLNQPASGIHAPAVPAPVGEPAAADAAPPADPDLEVATDTDVASWIDGAKRQYDTCRDRLQALIDWWDDDCSQCEKRSSAGPVGQITPAASHVFSRAALGPYGTETAAGGGHD